MSPFRNRIAALSVLVATLAGCGQSTPSPSSRDTLHRGISGEPSTLDPAASADTFSGEVIRDLYEGLTTEMPDGHLEPGVAERWEIDPGGTLYTFHLRSGLQWSDGKPLTANDFVLAWRRAVDPTAGAAGAELLSIVAHAHEVIAGRAPASALGVSAPNALTLEVTLEQPAPYFLGLLAQTAAMPIASAASARSHDPAQLISNGAYVLTDWRPGTSLSLKRNSRYWNRERVAIAAIDYQVVSDEAAMLRRYRAENMDLTDNVPANEVPNLRRERPQELISTPFLATAYYSLNLTAKPFAAGTELRQALAMAIDRKRVVTALGSGQAETYGFVAPGTWNYTPQVWDWHALPDEARIAKARELYVQAGYSTAAPLKLHVLYNSNPGIRNTAIVIATMWKEVLGIETSLDEEEYRVFLDTRHDKSRWQLARLSWGADFDDAGNFLETLRSNSVNNDSAYKSPVFDSLLNEAAHTASADERRSKLEAAERIMLADYPIIPLYQFVSKRLVKPYVAGAMANSLNHLPSKNLSFRDLPGN